MKLHRPSPALIVAIIALVVACAGTATAASLLIKNTSQIANGVVNSGDLRNGGVQGVDIASSTIGDRHIRRDSITTEKLSGGLRATLRGRDGFTAQEVVRKAGPEGNPAGVKTVATMQALPAGTYALWGKTTLSPVVSDNGLGEIFRNPATGSGHCILDAAGDVDDARAPILTPYTRTPQTLNMQMTRSVDKPTDIKIICDVNVPWRASDTSIMAIKLTGSTRSDTTG